MQKMMVNEVELAERWNLSPKTLQRWRERWPGTPVHEDVQARRLSGGRGPRLRISSPAGLGLGERRRRRPPERLEPDGPARDRARDWVALYIFCHKQTRDSLGVRHRSFRS